ncbi:MAG TPA: hypothetical protein VM658_03850 [bacterium]|nr:hypothetical protein [bacterium]
MQTLKMKFNYPFQAAGERCGREALGRDDYDPASLFRWGNMLGMSVLGMLKAAEREFGEAGQAAMIEALVEVGRDVGRQMLEGVAVPADVTPIEFISAFASWINREIYASPEDPRIEDAEHCSFDILWCPHQDSYKAFDCRVQRYLVQGMIEAARERFAGLDFQVKAVKTIPSGSPVCTFELWQKQPGDKDDWEHYSVSLAKKALQKSKG